GDKEAGQDKKKVTDEKVGCTIPGLDKVVAPIVRFRKGMQLISLSSVLVPLSQLTFKIITADKELKRIVVETTANQEFFKDGEEIADNSGEVALKPDELDLEFAQAGRIDRRLYIALPDAKQILLFCIFTKSEGTRRRKLNRNRAFGLLIDMRRMEESYSTLAQARLTVKPTHDTNVDIPNIHECKQTLYVSAGTSINVQKEQRLDLSAVVSKSSAVTIADTSDKRQQQPDSTPSTSTLATTVTADGNFDL
ncbi:hypothetical protein Tco_0808133, partial [Tanacetum coccineum]